MADNMMDDPEKDELMKDEMMKDNEMNMSKKKDSDIRSDNASRLNKGSNCCCF